MESAIIATVGTLLGAITAWALQQRADRTARANQRTEQRCDALVSHVSTLAAALAAHRRAMWVREDLRLTGAPGAAYAAARADSHITRAAVTAPLAAVSMLAPTLRPAAHDAADATYALRAAPDTDALTSRRTAAIHAIDLLIEQATHLA